jgi:hypothetical protein
MLDNYKYLKYKNKYLIYKNKYLKKQYGGVYTFALIGTESGEELNELLYNKYGNNKLILFNIVDITADKKYTGVYYNGETYYINKYIPRELAMNSKNEKYVIIISFENLLQNVKDKLNELKVTSDMSKEQLEYATNELANELYILLGPIRGYFFQMTHDTVSKFKEQLAKIFIDLLESIKFYDSEEKNYTDEDIKLIVDKINLITNAFAILCTTKYNTFINKIRDLSQMIRESRVKLIDKINSTPSA